MPHSSGLPKSCRLRGYGAFVVSASLKNGVIGEIEIVSEKERPCRVLCPWESGMAVFCGDVPVPCAVESGRSGPVYLFDTEPGALYHLAPIG